MERFRLRRDERGGAVLDVPYRGADLLAQRLCSKGTAFSREERAAFGLEGLLPHAVSTMEQQSRRVYASIRRKGDPLEKYIGLIALQDRNEHLFYRVLVDHLEEFLPIVYTPTVGLACQEWSRIFRRPRGLWITPEHRGRIAEVLETARLDDVRLIVATDNERILGLGDQGAGGMGIPIGKLALYTAAAGIHPAATLPVSLDVGTDNRLLLEDDLYLGWRKPRLRGPEYDALVDEFVDAVRRRFPRALLQWEDFKKGNAFRLLDRYRGVLPCFNDDIQGTAAVAVAAITAATRVTKRPLAEQRIVILGAGAAGIGIARLLRTTLARAGVEGEALTGAIAILDSRGLLVDDTEIADAYKRQFAWPAALAKDRGLGLQSPRDLEAVVRGVRPSVLIGTSGQPGVFTPRVARAMTEAVSRPVILPLSNPTSLSEATPADLLEWTDGRALVATGSPFEPVAYGGGSVRVGQANNAFVFPGVGLGAIVSESREITEEMFAAAAVRLAAEVSDVDLAAGSLFPPIPELRRVSAAIAESVVREACSSGVGRPIDDRDIPRAVADAVWEPEYPALNPV